MRDAWNNWCDALRQLGELVESSARTDLERAEGYRYLTRLVRLGLEMQIEHGNPENPSLYSLSHETAKVGADNPDNVYLNAAIDGRYQYEITGTIGEARYMSFGTKENRYAIDGTMASTGELDKSALQTAEDGSVRIVVSSEPADGNWLPMTATSNMLLVRQTFDDRSREAPARLSIRRLDAAPRYRALSLDDLEQRLSRVLAIAGGTASMFLGWVKNFERDHHNRFRLGDQRFFQAAGGDPNICYVYAYWELAPDEVLQVVSEVPRCELWNFQLTNPWMESLDYRFFAVHLNSSQAALDEDGRIRIHVSHKPVAGLRNNLTTLGHERGLMLMRWVGADTHPLPALKRVKLSAVAT
ncbi:MAG: DUF1214 domain-containing protein [Gammaproteobacteria bacterium]|nr:DUF1214 domain-containing protein [Gammaproteobacteria bacterium]